MTFSDFKDQINAHISINKPTFIEYVLMNPIIALSLSILVLSLAVLILKENKYSSLSTLYHKSFHFLDILLGALVASSIVLFLFFVGFSGSYHFSDFTNYDKEELITIYAHYMDQQETVRYNIVDLEIDNDTMNATQQQVVLRDNLDCHHCVKENVSFKYNENDRYYTNLSLLISYSLSEGEKPYILSKPPLRESVSIFNQNALYNPVLYLPVSQGGFQ